MNSKEIFDCLSNNAITNKHFRGVFAADELPRYGQSSKFYIVNTDPSYKKGEHWVAIFTGKIPEFFDSCGSYPSSYDNGFETLLINNGPTFAIPNRRIQSLDSLVCGQYCIYYVYHRCLGYSMNDIVGRWGDNLVENDRELYEWFT